MRSIGDSGVEQKDVAKTISSLYTSGRYRHILLCIFIVHHVVDVFLDDFNGMRERGMDNKRQRERQKEIERFLQWRRVRYTMK